MLASGKVFKYGDNIDTDVIIPARYLNTPDMKELASHCMEDIDKEFAQKVEEGDIIVANKNFGCGSSREHAPIAIKESGISCVIASTFARIFYRNAINIGLPILECDEAAKGIEVETSQGTLALNNKVKYAQVKKLFGDPEQETDGRFHYTDDAGYKYMFDCCNENRNGIFRGFSIEYPSK